MVKKKKSTKKSFSKLLILPLFAILLLSVSTALIVNYLSNTASAKVTISSPFQAGIASGNQVGTPDFTLLSKSGTLTLPSGFMGDVIEATVGFQNLDDKSFDVTEEYNISSPSITCADFESITWQTCAESEGGFCKVWGNEQTIPCTEGMVIGTGANAKIAITYPNHYDAGELNMNNFRLDLANYAQGTYTFSVDVIPRS